MNEKPLHLHNWSNTQSASVAETRLVVLVHFGCQCLLESMQKLSGISYSKVLTFCHFISLSVCPLCPVKDRNILSESLHSIMRLL